MLFNQAQLVKNMQLHIESKLAEYLYYCMVSFISMVSIGYL